MHILVAPNAFKHGLDAAAAAQAIKEGFMESNLNCTCECFPIGDGGDGTGELIVQHLKGTRVAGPAQDALSRALQASFGLVENGQTAVIEMADTAGLRLLKREELNPLLATCYGTGMQLLQALYNGANKIILAMGGSATVDGGLGILRAVGARFFDGDNREIRTPRDLINLATIELAGIDERLEACELVVLCDVANYLAGEQGAAAVFGPQKGATPVMVQELDNGLSRLANIIKLTTGREVLDLAGAGTAGGAAAGLYGLLNAKLVNGIDYFLDLTGFDAALQRSDLVITAEGSIDEQTLEGKGPFGVARRAKEKGLPVFAFAGRVPLNRNEALQQYFDALLPIGNQPAELSIALKDTGTNLARTSCMLGNILAKKMEIDSSSKLT